MQKVCTQSKLAHTVTAYPGFPIAKQLGVLQTSWVGTPLYRKLLLPSILSDCLNSSPISINFLSFFFVTGTAGDCIDTKNDFTETGMTSQN